MVMVVSLALLLGGGDYHVAVIGASRRLLVFPLDNVSLFGDERQNRPLGWPGQLVVRVAEGDRKRKIKTSQGVRKLPTKPI